MKKLKGVVALACASMLVACGGGGSPESTSTANVAPTSNAGNSQSVLAGALVTLDGSSSTDANSDQLTYSWFFKSKPAGSVATLSGSNSAHPTFTADVPGVYVTTLVVNDGMVNSLTSTVAVTVVGGGSGSGSGSGSNSAGIPTFEIAIIDTAALRGIGDFNGDKRLDLIAEVPGATSFEEPKAYVYRQEPDGTYFKIPISTRLPYAFAAEADFDLDGRDDFPTLPLGGSCALSVMFFSPDLQTFTTTAGLTPGTCAVPSLRALDFNRDGKTDLVPLSSTATTASLGTATRTFVPLQLQKPFALQGDLLAAADIDGDGTVDLLAANSAHAFNEVSISIAYGAGSGNYTNIKNWTYPNLTQGYSSPSGPAFVADFNKDGFKDILYCPSTSGSCMLVLGDGPQSFAPIAQLVSLTGGEIVVADINGDGNMDVIVSTTGAGVQIRLGDGKGIFAVAQTVPGSVGSFSSPSTFRIADINGDKKPDLILTTDGVLRVFKQR
ncbi:FG-GAP-like repeat-containing protein [Rhizobacter fulvus]